METVEKTIEVEAPVTEVYHQWTRFEEFPEFMEGIEEVMRLDDKHLHWVAEIAGRKKEWDTEIIEQAPGERIAWRRVGGAPNDSVVNLRPAAPQRTLVTWQVNYEPEGILERSGNAAGILSRRVEGDLERFRDFLRQRVSETGAWRKEIPPEEREAA